MTIIRDLELIHMVIADIISLETDIYNQYITCQLH